MDAVEDKLRKKLLDDQSYLDKILLEGVEKANLIASKKIKKMANQLYLI